MTRLLDRLLGGGVSARFNDASPSGAAFLLSSFGRPDAEAILPGWHNATSAYAGNGVVFSVILARLSLFTEAEFKFQNRTTGKLYGSPALLKLEEPWPNGSTGELLARMEQDVSLAGNAYVRDAGEHLERLRPDWVTIVSRVVQDQRTGTEVRRVVGYFYDPPPTDDREPAFYEVDEVAHWAPIPDPTASFRGMSWLTPVLREVDADAGMTDYKRAYLSNAATPNMLVRYSARIGKDKIDRLREQIDARHGGVDNAFRTLILDEGADVTMAGSNLDAMRFDTVQAAGENRIAVAGGVPGIVVGLKEGLAAATYSNYEQAMRRFADLTMRPNWRSACAALEHLVDVPADSRLWYDTRGIAALRQGEKDRADTAAVLATAANTLITAGYSPESVVAYLDAGDVALLQHTGLMSVQLQEPGATPPKLPNAKDAGGDRATYPTDPNGITVHVDVAPPPVEVTVPLTVPVDVSVPEQPAPTVNVRTSPTPAPIVHVGPAPVVIQPTEPRTRRVVRDREGNITGVVEE